MNQRLRDEKDNIRITHDGLGTRYSCAICGYAPDRMRVRVRGWGKAAVLRKTVRQHVKENHKR